MQKWFFLDHKNTGTPKKKTQLKKMSSVERKDDKDFLDSTRQWKFSVEVPNIGPREKVYLTGNIPELGKWNYKKLICMTNEQGDIWTVIVTIPDYCDIEYRYTTGLIGENENTVIVRKWETNLHPRVLKGTTIFPVVDTFGEYNNEKKIGRGWLTSYNMIQFKFVNNPLKLKSRLANHLLNIKVTPVKLSFSSEPQIDESSLSTDTVDAETPTGVLVEVSTFDNNPDLCIVRPQEQFGRCYRPNDILLINVLMPSPEALAYLIDFYSYSSRASSEDPPCHIGYTYVLPNMFKQSEGTLELPVTCNVKHRPLGTVNIQYLVITPMLDTVCDLKVTYTKHWDSSWTGLEVGHRGIGASFKTKEGPAIRENTVASLKKAAMSGADLLEFDVQLSKDMIPVIYHDYHVCISMKRKRDVCCSEMLELPVKDLTLEHLQKLKVYHLTEGRSHETLFNDEDLDEHQPFPTLEHVLKVLDKHVGFNVELKWTMELNDGTFELNNPFDMNTYVDKVLEVVLKYADERRIVFSCFNPDICTLVRNKQNKYPIMFLTVGVSNKYQPYRDVRCLSIPAAVQNAVCSDILGIVVHTEDLLRDPSQVKLVTDAGLVIFCWGDDNNDKNTIKKLKEMGLHAVIYDKLDQFTTKEVKESIFLMEARESQRELMELAAFEGSALDVNSPSTRSRTEDDNIPSVTISVPEQIPLYSTVTSLESLASSIEIKDIKGNQLKRTTKDIIMGIDKELQLKEPRCSFLGMFPSAGDSSKVIGKRPRQSKETEE